MKKIVTVTLLALVLTTNSFAGDQPAFTGYKMTPQYRTTIKKFINALKGDQRLAVAAMISYPLERPYPIPAIANNKELLIRYDQIFDRQLIKKITTASIAKDWSTAGWRGYSINDGTVWFNYDNKLSAINHLSATEKRLQTALIALQKKQLHTSLQQFAAPCLVAETAKYKIRIDKLSENSYRYAAWEHKQPQTAKPDLVITNGKIVYEGSGGNHYYQFTNGDYRYRLYINLLGTANTPPAVLEVDKNSRQILKQNIVNLY